MTQENLASASGISIRTIQRIEKGLSKASPYTMKQLAEALDVEISTLLLNKEETSPAIKKNSVGILKLVNIGALSVLLLPLGNIIFPLIVFLKNKEDGQVNIQESLLWIPSTLIRGIL